MQQIQREIADPASHLQGRHVGLRKMFPTEGPVEGQKPENMVLVQIKQGEDINHGELHVHFTAVYFFFFLFRDTPS